MAGSSFRWARSPVAPKMVNSAGSLAPPTRSPSRRGLAGGVGGVTCPPRPGDRAPSMPVPYRILCPGAGRSGGAAVHAFQLGLDRLSQRVERFAERLHAVHLE